MYQARQEVSDESPCNCGQRECKPGQGHAETSPGLASGATPLQSCLFTHLFIHYESEASRLLVSGRSQHSAPASGLHRADSPLRWGHSGLPGLGVKKASAELSRTPSIREAEGEHPEFEASLGYSKHKQFLTCNYISISLTYLAFIMDSVLGAFFPFVCVQSAQNQLGVLPHPHPRP